LIANKIFQFTVVLFTFAIKCTENSSQQCLSTINMLLSDEDKILIKNLFAISMG